MREDNDQILHHKINQCNILAQKLHETELGKKKIEQDKQVFEEDIKKLIAQLGKKDEELL
jgi:hypothetical protein